MEEFIKKIIYDWAENDDYRHGYNYYGSLEDVTNICLDGDFNLYSLVERAIKANEADIQERINRAVLDREKEIVEWLRVRCLANCKVYGTDKWNSDMYELINLIEKR